jgi:regulatory protein
MPLRHAPSPLSSERRPDPEAARTAAVALLAKRDFAAGELLAKLISRGFRHETARAVIEELTAAGTLNEARYAENYVAWHAARGQGPLRIGADLRKHGVAEALIEAALAGGPDWMALAGRVRRSKFGSQAPARKPGRCAFCSIVAFHRIISARPLAPIPTGLKDLE